MEIGLFIGGLHIFRDPLLTSCRGGGQSAKSLKIMPHPLLWYNTRICLFCTKLLCCCVPSEGQPPSKQTSSPAGPSAEAPVLLAPSPLRPFLLELACEETNGEKARGGRLIYE